MSFMPIVAMAFLIAFRGRSLWNFSASRKRKESYHSLRAEIRVTIFILAHGLGNDGGWEYF